MGSIIDPNETGEEQQQLSTDPAPLQDVACASATSTQPGAESGLLLVPEYKDQTREVFNGPRHTDRKPAPSPDLIIYCRPRKHETDLG